MTLEGKPYRPSDPGEAIARGVAFAAEDRHRSSLLPRDWPGHLIEQTISLPHLARWYPFHLLIASRSATRPCRPSTVSGSRPPGPTPPYGRCRAETSRRRFWPAGSGARALLLLDEPFQGVDVGARQDIIATIRSHRSRATLIATSDPEEAFEVADRVFVIDHHTLRPAEISANPSPSFESLSA